MAEEIVEKTTENATQETEAVDYDKELEVAISESAKKEEARKGFALRHKKDELEEESEDESEKMAKKVASILLPQLQSTAEAGSLDVKLDKLAGGNETLKKLIKIKYENNTNPSQDMDSRLEDAFAIANKKVIEKKAKEINLSVQNRSQISNIGQGTNQETYQKPGENILSDAQINDLKKFAKANNLDEKKFLEKAMQNLRTAQ